MGLSYLSKIPGAIGTLKNSPEDFVVEEITPDGTLLEIDKKISKDGNGDFTYFIMQKKDWNTLQALRAMAKVLNVSARRFDFAGTKDKRAITTQLVSGYKVDNIANLNLKDINVNGIWKGEKKIRIGDLLGNRFTIRVLTENQKALDISNRIYDDLNGLVPNYFGEQRFGSVRKNTHIVGRNIILGRFKDAVLNYLTYIGNEENPAAVEARKELANDFDYKKALQKFPPHLKYEKLMINHLAKNPSDYVNALRKLPRSLLLMFVHAYQSYIFNELLSARISEGVIRIEEGEYTAGTNVYGFPDLEKKSANGFITGKLIGYETILNEREKQFLENEGIEKESFKIRSLPEISSKGSRRTLLTPMKDFKCSLDNGVVYSFSLQAGSYATMALREFLDEKVSSASTA